MKTRETIEAQSVETTDATPKYARGQNPRSRQNLLSPWKPGQSGNPNGRPKHDISQVIARAIFEKNPEMIYKAYGSLLAKGSAFGFQVIAERAYGKLKETRDTGSEFNEVPDADLQQRLDAILRDLGLAQQVDACRRSEGDTVGASKANGSAQDPHILPGNGTVKA